MVAERSLPECWIAGHWERRHGSHCACRLLAAAAHAVPSGIDYGSCRRVLQRRWGMTCDHVTPVPRVAAPIALPPHDSRDPVHMLLIANAERASE